MLIKTKNECQPLTILLTIGIISLWSSCSLKNTVDIALGIEHVVVIGFDGLSPDGLQNAKTPNFDKIMNEGAHTMHARAVMPTSSSPNWASMIMGAGPEQHGITSNAWEKDHLVLPAIAQSEDFIFPTIFHVIDSQIKNAEIGAVYHWGGFGRLFEKEAVDYDVHPKSEEETAEIARFYIQEKKPKFTFIHFDHVDHAGHEFGHGTPEYYSSVEKADFLLGKVITAIETGGMAKNTLVIISADHGGLGKGHGGETLQEIEIPFIVWGKSVKKNHKIKYPVYQYDNAATVAFALGLKTPEAWIGRPVKTAFEGFQSEDAYPVLERLKEPIILPATNGYKKAGGLFDEHLNIQIKNPNKEGKMRYTLDGTVPTKDAELVGYSIEIDHNTVVKSAIFNGGKINSPVAEAYFRIKDKINGQSVRYAIFYLDDLSFVPVLANRKPDVKGNCFEITSDEIRDKIKENTAVRFSAQIEIDQADSYTFYTRSDDGSKLLIANTLVVDNDGDHGVREKDGTIDLAAGKHQLEVLWFNGGGDGWLDVYIESPNMPKQILPTTMLRTE